MSDPADDNEEKEGKHDHADKDISLKSMVIAAVWIGVLSLAKAAWSLFAEQPFGLTMGEIVLSGTMLAAVFSPVYLSIALDKIKEIKVG